MWLRCPLLLLSCAIVVAIQGVDACVWEGHKFNVGPLTVPAKQHAPPHSGTPSYWHGSICTPTDAPASLHDCAGRANLYEEDASTKTCLGAFVAVSSEWSTVALPNVGLALANSFIDEAKNSSIVVTLQCSGAERGTRMTKFANNGVLLGARWLGFVTSDLPHKFCEAHIMHNTTTEAPSSRPTLVPTSMPTTTAETTVTARPTTTTAAPPPVTTASPRPTSSSSCRLNGQSFTLPYVAFPYGMNDQVNSSWYNLYWTFSLCEPVPLSSTCYDGRPANVFQSVSNTYIDGGSIGGCVGAFSSGPEDWQQGVGQIQKNFSSMVPTQPGILAVTITCGTSPIVNPSTAYTEWMVTSLMEDEIPVWSVFLTSSNVPGCAAPVPATPNFCAVSNGNTFNLPNTSLTINITNEQGLNEASTWSYNLCSPSTFASQCGGNSNANVSQMPVYLWKRSAAGGCEIAFTQQDEWMQYGNLISAFFYSVDMRFIANVTLVGSSMYPFFALATSWPAVVVDGGSQTMFNMVFGSNELPTSPGPTDCEFQSQNFLLGFVNATVNIYFDETGITEPQYWVVSPCYAIQNPYCDSWVSQSFATQQAGTSTSPCIAGFAPTNSAVWTQLPSYDGISMVMYSATGQAINISIRCCLNCGTSLEVDPRYEFWTWTPNGIQMHLASNNIPQVACSMPTPPPIPAESCYITSGWNFYPTFLTGTFPSVLYDGNVMQYTWYFSLCAAYQPVGCIETADISILLNGECVAQFNMNSNYVAYGTSISATYYNSFAGAGNMAASLNVTVGCGGTSPLELSTVVGNPIYEASSPEGGYSWYIDMLSNVIPSPICSPSTPVPSSPPGPSTTCSLPGGSEITLPSLNSVLWPLSVENKPAVPKLWTISLCSLMTQSTCSTSPTLSFYIMSMNAEDSNDCQVAFTAQTQQWSWTTYRGSTAMTAVFTNEAGNRLANVTVVNRGTSTLTPFSPDDGAGWPVLKLGDSYMWNLYFNSDSVVESLAAAAAIRARV